MSAIKSDTPLEGSAARKVLFIGGKGRSGSTLLARLLSEHPDIAAVGELRFVADRGFRDNQLCSCRLPFRDCPFWREVTSTVAHGSVDRWSQEFIRLSNSVARMRHAPKVLVAAGVPTLKLREQSKYGLMLGELVDAIAAVSGAAVILDSSKDPIHGLYLAMCQTVSLSVVHLVRDCRGVAFSLQRRRVRPEVADQVALMPRTRPARTSLDWNLRNMLAQALGRLSSHYQRVLYEELVEDPPAVRDKLFGVVGLEPATVDVRRLPHSVEHEVSGNPMRFDAEFTVRPDSEWIDSMQNTAFLTSTLLGAPLLKHYGYPLLRGKSASLVDSRSQRASQ